ncbi:hypothetical protein D3C76_1328900 [compost metagenome]
MSTRPSIIEKLNAPPPTQLSRFGHDFTVATGTKNRKACHGLVPLNFAAVTSPSALIPSRTKTFLIVSKITLISNHKD